MTPTHTFRLAERAAGIAAEIESLHDWQAAMDAQDAREIAFFEGLLAQYYDWLKATDRLGRTTGYKLPEGVLRRRTKGVT
jgi:hypothetical protein